MKQEQNKSCKEQGSQCKQTFVESLNGWYCPRCRTVDTERFSPQEETDYIKFKKFVRRTINEDWPQWKHLFETTLATYFGENKVSDVVPTPPKDDVAEAPKDDVEEKPKKVKRGRPKKQDTKEE